MRFITRLAYETEKLLKRIEQKSKYYQVRQRAKCIQLSYQGFQISKIMKILKVGRNTIYNWLNNWEKYNLIGLYNKKGRGRKTILEGQKEEQVKEWIKNQTKNLKIVQEKIKSEWKIEISKETIKRLAKKKGMGWYRIKRRVKGKPEPELYKQKKEELRQL